MLTFILTGHVLANVQITEIMRLSTFHVEPTVEDFERLSDEEERWKETPLIKREFWREVYFQSHFHPAFKSQALRSWLETFPEGSIHLKELEDAAVHAHYELIQAMKAGHEERAEHWSYMASIFHNTISNLPDRQKEEITKILRIRLDKKVAPLFI